MTPRQLHLQAAAYRTAANEQQGVAALLPQTNQSGTLPGMHQTERLRHAAGSSDPGDPFLAAIRDAGYTLRSLAEAVGKSHAHLSRARRGEDSIARALAEEIERLTGLKASRRNWPKLRD